MAYKANGVLVSFGPNMDLAKGLLEKGERETVLRYFELCSGFWKDPRALLDPWKDTVKRGEVPDFMYANHGLRTWRYSNY